MTGARRKRGRRRAGQHFRGHPRTTEPPRSATVEALECVSEGRLGTCAHTWLSPLDEVSTWSITACSGRRHVCVGQQVASTGSVERAAAGELDGDGKVLGSGRGEDGVCAQPCGAVPRQHSGRPLLRARRSCQRKSVGLSERLHGVIVFYDDATPICGFAKSSSPMTTARSTPRAAALSRPSVTSRERGSMSGTPRVCSVGTSSLGRVNSTPVTRRNRLRCRTPLRMALSRGGRM